MVLTAISQHRGNLSLTVVIKIPCALQLIILTLAPRTHPSTPNSTMPPRPRATPQITSSVALGTKSQHTESNPTKTVDSASTLKLDLLRLTPTMVSRAMHSLLQLLLRVSFNRRRMQSSPIPRTLQTLLPSDGRPKPEPMKTRKSISSRNTSLRTHRRQFRKKACQNPSQLTL